MTVSWSDVFQTYLMNQGILTACFTDVIYALAIYSFIAKIRTSYNTSTYTMSERRPLKTFWFVNNVLKTQFCCVVIKRLRNKRETQLL